MSEALRNQRKWLFAWALLAALGVIAWKSASSPAPGSPLIATSSLGASSAVLFLVDPDSRTLAAYEAIPGEEGGLRWLGARKIDHDLKLTKYRDFSEFSYSELREQYDARADSLKSDR